MKVAILGAGIAGLTSAIALAKQGIENQVFERRKQISHLGAGIVCWPNACFVLDQLGLFQQVMHLGGQMQSMQRFDTHGNTLGKLDINKINNIMGYPSISITRQHLIQILYQETLRLGIKIHFNHKVIGFEDESVNQHNSTQVLFDNNTKLKADLIIGADGRMQSPSRAYVLGNNTPQFQHFINWIGLFESKEKRFHQLDVQDYWGEGERFGIVPINEHLAYWAAGKHSDLIEETVCDHKSDLLALFSHWPSPIKSIIQGSDSNKIHKLYIHDHDPIATWHKNNVLLIGDAAHAALPTSGQGACQALEDAWLLSLCLTQQKANTLTSILQDFTEQRLAKTSNIIYAGRHLAKSIFAADKETLIQRNLATSQLDYDEMAAAMARLWSQGLLENH